jgi:hypothetical protein
MFIGVHYTKSYSCHTSIKLEFSRQTDEKFKSKWIKISSLGKKLLNPDGQREMVRQVDANSRSSQFAHNFNNGLKIYIKIAKILSFLQAALVSGQNTYTCNHLTDTSVCIPTATNSFFTLIFSLPLLLSGIIWYHLLLCHYHSLTDTPNILQATERSVRWFVKCA